MKYFDFLVWFPENVSTFGAELDHLFEVIWWIDVAIFFLTYGLLAYFLIKYRQKPGVRARGYHGNNLLEFTWTLLPTILFGGLGVYCDGAWETTKNSNRIPKPDVEIEVLGKQFNWVFRYPGADGVLGKRNDKIRTTDNLFGIDPSDPHGKDDIIIENDLHLPINKNVLVRLSSVDVLHSFFLPNFRVKQDALPGSWMKVWFNGIKAGKYEIACAELCGASHYNMRGTITMHSLDEYNTWYDTQIKGKAEQMAQAPAPEAKPAEAEAQAGEHHGDAKH
ncbi:MAG: cytochrome c oxidase subunit II [Candidatus Kapabacteria bacterium]|nr:cytochrome c oxidase subunit II [Candidatus Kapabacteria bacterium]